MFDADFNARKLKLLTACSEIVCNNPDAVRFKNGLVIYDPAMVCAIFCKSARMIKLFEYTFVGDITKKNKDFSVNYIDKTPRPKSTYSIEYFKKIIDILCEYDEKVTITFAQDSPIKFVNKDFEIILAPRIEQNEECNWKVKKC